MTPFCVEDQAGLDDAVISTGSELARGAGSWRVRDDIARAKIRWIGPSVLMVSSGSCWKSIAEAAGTLR